MGSIPEYERRQQRRLPKSDRGMFLARANCMEFICRHCNEVCDGDAYRVRSEEEGVILLDMIVCYACSQEARGLELWTQKIDLPMESVQSVFH